MKHWEMRTSGDNMTMKTQEQQEAEEPMVLKKIHLISLNKTYIKTKAESTTKHIQQGRLEEKKERI